MRRVDFLVCVAYVFYPVCIFIIFYFSSLTTIAEDNMTFPGAMGWGGETHGAWGHPEIAPRILRVTSLNGGTEEGTLKWALTRSYPRVVVFEVGGVIDWEWGYVDINNPYMTIAGQTAPSPGITLIRGQLRVRTHDIIVQHISIRPGLTAEGQRTGAVAVYSGGINVVFDHCSITWAMYSGFSVSAADNSWKGDTPEEWHSNGPHKVTLSNCIVSEGVKDIRPNGLGSGLGGLVASNVTDIAYLRNLWAYIHHRNPKFSPDTWGVYANNYVRGWGDTAVYDATVASSWGGYDKEPPVDFIPGSWAVEGNYAIRGEHSHSSRGFVHIWGEANPDPPIALNLEVFFNDNIVLDYDEETPWPEYTEDLSQGRLARIIELDERPTWHESIELLAAENVPEYIRINVGSRPWERDPIDERIVNEAMDGTGVLVTSDNWGSGGYGYPEYEPTYSKFIPDEWDLRYMIPLAGYWSAPELITPGNNTMDVGYSPTFIWDAEDHLSHFTLQIATDVDFTTLVVDQTGIMGTSHTISNLDGSMTYFWRVRGHNATGPSKWSEVRHFRIESETSSMKIFLRSGWNLISSYLLPENTSIEYIFADLIRNHVLVKNNEGEVYWPQYGLNEIGDWVYQQGYRVYVEENDTLTINGHLVHPEETQINLYEGWNQVAYLRNSPLSTDVALSSINDRILIVINNAGEVFWPEYDIDTIKHLIPGQGYSMYLTEPAILIYPANEQ
jgi:hypothetical protein